MQFGLKCLKFDQFATTHVDFPVRCVVRVFRTRKSNKVKSSKCALLHATVSSSKMSSGKIERNVCAHSFRGFMPATQKMPIGTSEEKIGHVVVGRVWFSRPRNTDDTSDGKIGACSTGLNIQAMSCCEDPTVADNAATALIRRYFDETLPRPRVPRRLDPAYDARQQTCRPKSRLTTRQVAFRTWNRSICKRSHRPPGPFIEMSCK